MLQESYVHIYSTIHKDWISLLASRSYYLCPPRMLKYDFRQGLALFGNFGPCFLASECPAWFCFHILSGSVLCAVVVGNLFSEEIFVVFRRNIVPHSSTFAKYLLSHPKVEEKLKTLKNPVKIAILDCEQCEQLWRMAPEMKIWIGKFSVFQSLLLTSLFSDTRNTFCGNVDQFHNLGQWVQMLEF